jgi:hypothetical protein
MPDPSQPSRPAPDATKVVGNAIQDLTAARLGRGLMPLGVLAVAGGVQLATVGPAGPDGLALVGGASMSAAAMIAYGQRVVQLAFGRPARWWMTLAAVGSLIPPAFGVYVLGWRGLRTFALGGGWVDASLAILHGALGVWVLRSWLGVMQVERLARTMTVNTTK